MKTFVLTLLLLLTSNQAMALSDFDRLVLFASNGVSMGTYIAQMEGEIARIKLNYEKKFAELQKTMEVDYQAYLKKSLTSELTYLNSQKKEYTSLLASVKKRNEGFSQFIELSKTIYQGRIKKEALLEQLKQLNQVYPDASKDWIELMQKSLEQADGENISAAQYEQIYSRSLFVQSEATAMEKELINQIDFLDLQIQRTDTELKALP